MGLSKEGFGWYVNSGLSWINHYHSTNLKRHLEKMDKKSITKDRAITKGENSASNFKELLNTEVY